MGLISTLIQKIITLFIRGLSMGIQVPFHVYAFFSGQAIYHWAGWAGFLFSIYALWNAVLIFFIHGLTITGFLEAAMCMVSAGIFLTIIQWLVETFRDVKGPFAFLAWTPGLGKLRALFGINNIKKKTDNPSLFRTKAIAKTLIVFLVVGALTAYEKQRIIIKLLNTKKPNSFDVCIKNLQEASLRNNPKKAGYTPQKYKKLEAQCKAELAKTTQKKSLPAP